MGEKDNLIKSSSNDFTSKEFRKEMIEILFLVVLAVCISFLIITFIGQRTVVRGSSMEPTLSDRNHLIVYKLPYFFENPKKGDIVVVDVPVEKRINKNEQLYIKRVIGVEGDKVSVKDKVVYLNDEPLEETNIIKESEDYIYVDFEEQIVPQGHAFVLGDNRVNSRDSREIGFVPFDDIKGKAIFRIWPLSKFGKVQ